MKLEELPHRIIQGSKSLKYKELDSDVKKMIADLEAEYNEYLSSSPDDSIFSILLQKSDNIGEYIYLNYVDHGQEIDYDIEELEEDNNELEESIIKSLVSSKAINIDNYKPETKNEQVLHNLWLSDRRDNLTRANLGEAGFDIGFWSPLGKFYCNVGRYRLERQSDSRGYKLRLNK